MFLTKAELKTVSVPQVVDKAINNDVTIVEDIITESIAIMISYLSGRFDTDAIFSAADNDRDRVVLKYLKDIVIHEIYTRKTDDFHQVTKSRYDEAMLWLEKVASGKIPAAHLPVEVLEEGEDRTGDGFIKYGGNTNYSNNY